MIWTKQFWKAAAERAAKTGGQAGLTALGGNLINAWTLDYVAISGFAVGGVILSLLTSLASSKVAGEGPSLGTERLPGGEA